MTALINRFHRMRLSTRFSLMLFVTLVIGVVVSGVVLVQVLQSQAEDNVTSRGEALLGMVNAVRTYTSQHVRPLLADSMETEQEFTSERVPAFSARVVFENLRGNDEFGDFMFKEASLDPQNPQNMADAFEASMWQQFDQNPDLHELNGFRDRDGQQVYYIMRPLYATSESCLDCHGDPQDAPQALINTYGDQNGFGWQVGDLIAVQTIYVPADTVLESARESQILMIGLFVVISGGIILLINLLLQPAVIRPITQVAGVAEKMSEDALDATTCAAQDLGKLTSRGDELGQLALVFQNMCREVYAREARLREQVDKLRVEIDRVQQQKEVAQITGSDYFQDLQSRAADIRRQRQARDAQRSSGDTAPGSDSGASDLPGDA